MVGSLLVSLINDCWSVLDIYNDKIMFFILSASEKFLAKLRHNLGVILYGQMRNKSFHKGLFINFFAMKIYQRHLSDLKKIVWRWSRLTFQVKKFKYILNNFWIRVYIGVNDYSCKLKSCIFVWQNCLLIISIINSLINIRRYWCIWCIYFNFNDVKINF